jgi:2-polyprenyl-3-methyl-5-hydroxy-6-metoxy-1,4-benzoquinol methylase
MGCTSPELPERWIQRALAERPLLTLVSGHCPFGHSAGGAESSRGFDYEYHSARNEFRGVLCRECGTWCLDPRPANADFSVIYPEHYSAFAMAGAGGDGNGLAFRAKAWLEQRKIRRYARSVGDLQGDVLDVGCADGLLLDGFVRAGFRRETLRGVDFHPLAVEQTRAKGYAVVEGHFEDVNLAGDRYRLIVMNQLIEHLTDPIAGLRKLHDLLVPGGHVFLETPNLDSPNARLARRRFWGGYHYPRHLYLFSPRTVAAALQLAGLEVVAIRYIPCPVQWVMTLNNALQERRHPPRALLRFIDWRNPLLLAFFTVVDLLLLPLGTANMQVVARRPPR